MTQDDFTRMTTPLARHGLTLAAGALATHGLIAPADAMTSYGAAAAAAIAAVAWSFIEKSRLLAPVVEGAPASDIEALAGMVSDFKSRGSSPVLVAHLAQTLSALAGSELAAVMPQPAARVPTEVEPGYAPPPPADDTPKNQVFAPVPAAETHGDMA